MMKTFRIAFFLLFVGFGYTIANAQQFDYPKYPRMDVNINSLEADIRLQPEDNKVEGSVNYNLATRRTGVDSLVLHAAHMEIENVRLFDEEVDFQLQNDSLFIHLSDSSENNEEFDVAIDYNATPGFGLFVNANETMWSSTLPASVRHWMPTFDHPRMTAQARINFTVPSGMEMIATGVLTDDGVTDVDHQYYTFETGGPVPLSALSFAVGNFDTGESESSQIPINIAVEETISEYDKEELFAMARDIIEESSEVLGQEYPFEELNILFLSDHFWETKSWATSTVFLYENGGDMETQLRRGIYGQWLGVYQREEQWAEAEGLNILHSALHFQLLDEPMLLDMQNQPEEVSENLYDVFSSANWDIWQQNFNDLETNWRETIDESLTSIAEWPAGVYSFDDYAEYWYEQSGQPRFEIPSFEDRDSGNTESDTVRYRVEYDLDEEEGELRLQFNAEQGMYEELVNLSLIRVTKSENDTTEVTFTGEEDSVMINLPILVETVQFDLSDYENLVLDEYKPIPFLIYEVRNAETVDERKEAAEKLGYYSEDPDLELAIRDMLNRDLEPEVEAALLSSLAEITSGDQGTQEVFLGSLESEHDEIKLAGLSALQNYPESETVREEVELFAGNTDELSMFKDAAKILTSLSDVENFTEFTDEVVQADTAGYKAIYTIRELANMGEADRAVRQAEYYLDPAFEYPVRASALGILVQHDDSAEGWRGRTDELLSDLDPRIRFLAVRGLRNIEDLNYEELLTGHREDEYDQRVFLMMEELLEEE